MQLLRSAQITEQRTSPAVLSAAGRSSAHDQMCCASGEQVTLHAAEACDAQAFKEHLRWGEIGQALRQISICRLIVQEPTDQRHNLAEVDPVSEFEHLVLWLACINERNTAAGSHNASELIEEMSEVGEVAKSEPAGHAVDASV
jgi:hypothetical protein